MTLFPYDSIYEYVKTFKKDKKVLLCKKKVNSRLVSNIPADTRILDEENLTLLPKATKNPVEVENERIAHIRDGVAVTKFIYWLKKNVGRIPITEFQHLGHVQDALQKLEQPVGGGRTKLSLLGIVKTDDVGRLQLLEAEVTEGGPKM